MRFDYQQQYDDERRRFEEEMDSRGLNWQAHWDRVEQDKRDNLNFWKQWEARWQS